MPMAVQKMFRALVCLSMLLNGCCIGWFMLSGHQSALGSVRSGRGTVTGELLKHTVRSGGINRTNYALSSFTLVRYMRHPFLACILSRFRLRCLLWAFNNRITSLHGVCRERWLMVPARASPEHRSNAEVCLTVHLYGCTGLPCTLCGFLSAATITATGPGYAITDLPQQTMLKRILHSRVICILVAV